MKVIMAIKEFLGTIVNTKEILIRQYLMKKMFKHFKH